MNVALIGSGNAFFKDEGIGLYAAKFLKENYTFTPALEIVDGGTLGFQLMPLLQECAYVLIANTSSSDLLEPGHIEVISDDTLLGDSGLKKTANEVEISEMLQICALSDNVAKTMIVSIVPEDIISVEVGLSDAMLRAWSAYIATILEQLEQMGISSHKKAKTYPLTYVIDLFANPSLSQGRVF
jgi:hydrogenase maturation protease